MIKGAKMSNGPENRKDWPVKLKPGQNSVEFPLDNVKCNDNTSPLDVSQVFIWAIWNLDDGETQTVFIQKLYLENDEK